METNRPRNELQEQLHEIERGENASWVVYPRTPAWWAIGFGLWAAALTLTIGRLEGVVQALIELGLIAVMGGAMAWDRRRRGTYPTGRPPRELRPAIGILVLGAIVVGASPGSSARSSASGWRRSSLPSAPGPSSPGTSTHTPRSQPGCGSD
jgi:hypothetical protein